MSLFKKKIPADISVGKDDSKESLDFLVHNMPKAETSQAKPAASDISGFSLSSSPSPAASGNSSYKKVGAIIISVGIVLILVLAYFAYNLLFGQSTPSSQVISSATSTPEESQVESKNQTASSTILEEPLGNEAINTASSSEMATSTELDITIVGETTTATSSVEMGELATSTSNYVPVLEMAGDSDNDGLDDVAESAFGTNQYMIDTDGDGYSDLQEIQNGYNPSGDGQLEASGFIAGYQNESYAYSAIYPAVWGQKNIGGDYFSVFNVPDGSLVQISVQENSRAQDIISWYRQEFSFFDTFDQNRLVRTYGNNQGIYSADGMTIYFTDSARKNIYIVSFVPVSEGKTDYFQIFQIMASSLKVE